MTPPLRLPCVDSSLPSADYISFPHSWCPPRLRYWQHCVSLYLIYLLFFAQGTSPTLHKGSKKKSPAGWGACKFTNGITSLFWTLQVSQQKTEGAAAAAALRFGSTLGCQLEFECGTVTTSFPQFLQWCAADLTGWIESGQIFWNCIPDSDGFQWKCGAEVNKNPTLLPVHCLLGPGWTHFTHTHGLFPCRLNHCYPGHAFNPADNSISP